jgi:hypothetical protein
VIKVILNKSNIKYLRIEEVLKKRNRVLSGGILSIYSSGTTLTTHDGRLLGLHGQARCPHHQELDDSAQHQGPSHLGYLGRHGSGQVIPV